MIRGNPIPLWKNPTAISKIASDPVIAPLIAVTGRAASKRWRDSRRGGRTTEAT